MYRRSPHGSIPDQIPFALSAEIRESDALIALDALLDVAAWALGPIVLVLLVLFA